MRAALLERILSQATPGGAAGVLPSERILAAELSTSRVTLRQATATLADWGLIEPVRGSGVRIRGREHWSLRVIPALLSLPETPSEARSLAAGALALRRNLARQIPASIPTAPKPGGFANAFAHAEAAWNERSTPTRFVALDASIARAVLEEAEAWASVWVWNELTSVAVVLASRLREPPPVPSDYLARQRDWLAALERGDGRTAARSLGTHLGRLDRELLRALPVTGTPATGEDS